MTDVVQRLDKTLVVSRRVAQGEPGGDARPSLGKGGPVNIELGFVDITLQNVSQFIVDDGLKLVVERVDSFVCDQGMYMDRPQLGALLGVCDENVVGFEVLECRPLLL